MPLEMLKITKAKRFLVPSYLFGFHYVIFIRCLLIGLHRHSMERVSNEFLVDDCFNDWLVGIGTANFMSQTKVITNNCKVNTVAYILDCDARNSLLDNFIVHFIFLRFHPILATIQNAQKSVHLDNCIGVFENI